MEPLLFEPPDSFGAATRNSAWANMENYHRGWLVLIVGDMQQGATLDVLLREATDALGTGAANIAGKAITQLTQAGGDGNDIICIELQTEEMNVPANYDFVGVQVVIAGAAVEYSYVFFACETRYAPVPVTQWTEVVG
jgi:hypothetical protein